MIKKHQQVYPSSKVAPEVIAAYGWRLLEELPTRINHIGVAVPSEEASSYLRELRGVIDDRPVLKIAAEPGAVLIEDFAVAHVPDSTEAKLGFFVLVSHD